MAKPVLRVEDMVVEFRLSKREVVHAVSGVSFDIYPGETLGLVGESGCGKSTTARSVMQLPVPTSGKVILNGTDLTALSGEELRRQRKDFQIIFQDPISSLNPRRKVKDIVEMPLVVMKEGTPEERAARVREVLTAVGLDPDYALDRRPFQFSGGQCQRISIARALVSEPSVLICDEPVSALDVSIQAQIINLLQDMKERYDLTMLFISHDLSVVKVVCDRVAVMYLGRICELTDSETLYRKPAHPYTAALLSAIPEADPNRAPQPIAMKDGELPSATNPPPGCRFHTRCPRAQQICTEVIPPLEEIAARHQVACHFPLSDD
ncbi:MAG: ABC transporter ATP-binding protein [Rhodospirillaceae bacterium]|nr:ABC transporter ATP-binding protein [Rhodospirillaceae bacterium]MBT4489151.1 ABC transporter ATP-binding protein [Rhodospirillaceae bacterium]MBT5191328.1 ABC transporter ATP-binding protein [Rhodospirillaceae bacterium]MBT5899306.1 ABC transporter ATP-binding protein [Rhodospirillaceae bacterium]MBT6429639.1 ABC transporter ATP-binding protein [Rhodospirillaceae bacterium]